MRIHLDRKPPDGVAIAFVVIAFLTLAALPILLSHLGAFWNWRRGALHAVGSAAAKGYCFRSFSAERSAPMRLHIDRNHLDGNLIALAVISLLIVIAMVY
jgi:hypothetical protein